MVKLSINTNAESLFDFTNSKNFNRPMLVIDTNESLLVLLTNPWTYTAFRDSEIIRYGNIYAANKYYRFVRFLKKEESVTFNGTNWRD